MGNLDTSQSTSQTDKEKPLRLFMARSRPDTSISEWVVDSGASAHMCCQRPWFVSFQKLNPTQPVIIGDGRSILATGKGRIEVTMDLLSVPALASKGLQVTFGNRGCRVIANDEVVAQATRRKSLYILMLSTTTNPFLHSHLVQLHRKPHLTSGIVASDMRTSEVS